MLDQTDKLPHAASEILGDLAAFSEQLGGTDALGRLPVGAAALSSLQVTRWADVERFVGEYTAEILVPHELPAIASAYSHAARFEVREFVALDAKLSAEPALRQFASASQHVGRTQLRRLRPLRGERFVQRYSHAVEEGEGKAWHTLVFGLVLALYSLPLRQGMVHFARQTVHGFVQAASTRVPVQAGERDQLVAVQTQAVLSAVDAILAPGAVRAE
jgi:urease accessory protein UreF